MAFTGTPVVEQVADNLFRITGVSLASGADGTISFSDATIPGEVLLVAPDWDPAGAVSLQDGVWLTMNPVTDAGAAVAIRVVKTGTDHSDFLVTLTNDDGSLSSGELEIYVHWR